MSYFFIVIVQPHLYLLHCQSRYFWFSLNMYIFANPYLNLRCKFILDCTISKLGVSKYKYATSWFLSYKKDDFSFKLLTSVGNHIHHRIKYLG